MFSISYPYPLVYSCYHLHVKHQQKNTHKKNNKTTTHSAKQLQHSPSPLN